MAGDSVSSLSDYGVIAPPGSRGQSRWLPKAPMSQAAAGWQPVLAIPKPASSDQPEAVAFPGNLMPLPRGTWSRMRHRRSLPAVGHADVTADSGRAFAVTVDLAALPGGEQCFLQMIASSGIRTAAAQVGPFAVPVRPSHAQILSPADGTSVREGERLMLRGLGFSSDFGTTTDAQMRWSSDRDGPLGAGHETAADRLSAGRHRIELTLPDGLGSESSAAVRDEVGPGLKA